MKFLGSAAVASASFIVVTAGCLVSQPVATFRRKIRLSRIEAI